MKNKQAQNLELKNAELEKELAEKNRYLEIEASLERMRTVAMGMRTPDDLLGICQSLFNELQVLEFGDLRNTIIHTYLNRNYFIDYDYSDFSKGHISHIPYSGNPILEKFVHDIRKTRDAFTQIIIKGNELKKWQAFRDSNNEVPDERLSNASALCYYVYAVGDASIGVSTFDSVTSDKQEILKRFRNVFDLAYRRYADIQLAEAQAREAQIELGLERVRARTMAMQKSGELKDIIRVVYDQFVHLNIPVEHAGFIIDYKTKDDMNIWLADKLYDPSLLSIPYFDSPHWNSFKEAKKKGTDFFANHHTFEGKNKFYRDLFELIPGVGDEAKEYYFTRPGLEISTVLLENVGLYIENFSGTPYTDAENNTLMRFGKVFQQAYTRFLDLQKAEAQARQAQIEAAMEKVRSRSLGMQKPEELTEVAQLLRKEMALLGVEELETSSIYIHNDTTGKTECWYAIKDDTHENKLVADHMDIDLDATWVGRQMLEFYHSGKEQVSIAMHGENRKEWINYCSTRSHNLDGYYGDAIPDRTYHLNKFYNGYMGAASPGDISAASRELLQRATTVFSFAYTRFNDLKIAEAHAIQAKEDLIKLQTAKRRAEVALIELKATQTQLIQSEKMASLGELTAGIAHEIQNPLNFVNNFSEVNREMIDELKEELRNGNTNEAIAIAEDIQRNEEKINHHGKRADSIVKGMLEHSRSSSGQKERTDLNAMADEYLRLAYHGLRAKDKTFNAELVTHFDTKLPKINVIPQDIGRVLLNLFNNAFYAVNQKSKTSGVDYKPEVSVSSSAENGYAVIKVKDNGVGIPEAIKDKIMQPFFTTKPTGEGTGLGLSLSYDIVVKGHGGKIEINTKAGEGSEFIISLPSN